MTKTKILLICGSLNQTVMMHKIAGAMQDCDCYFTPYYATGILAILTKLNLLNFTILGGRHKDATLKYLCQHELPVDPGGLKHKYDLVITGSDLIVPSNIRKTRLMLVQEGMLEQPNFFFSFVRWLNFPRFLANTAATGLSHSYDLLCAGSEGYRQHFLRLGIPDHKIVVTGMPNFDNFESYRSNDFGHHNHVLVLTSSIRETLGSDDRNAFLRKAKEIAGDREVIFKLHPNEDPHRAIREIRQYFKHVPILLSGNAHEMIANCDVLIAQTSSAIFTGLALGKEVHSYLNQAEMRKLLPVQNGGTSHLRIADAGQILINTPLAVLKARRGRLSSRQSLPGNQKLASS
ncbi:MAG: hypothetical protein WBI14_07015 [Anaerolineaceae bacterium]